MQISLNGETFIRNHEGCKLTAYQDSAGIWTIGVGHISGVYQGMIITSDQANQLLYSDLMKSEVAINQLVKVTLNQNQFDALCSLVFNIGANAFQSSTLLEDLNQGEYDGAAAQFIRWNQQRRGCGSGLTQRRTDEQELFQS